MEVDHLLDLLFEIREEIYKYCKRSDLINIACCSNAHYESILYLLWNRIRIPWRHVEAKSYMLAKKLDHLKFTSALCFFGNRDGYGDEIRSIKVADNIYAVLEHCNPVRLQLDSVSRFDCNEVVTQVFQTLNNIRHLSFRNYVLTGNLSNLNSLHCVGTLTIDSCFINDDDVKEITKLQILEELTLIGQSSITGESFEHLGSLTQLVKLKVGGVDNVLPAALNHLAKLTNLKQLHLDATRINNETLDNICQCLTYLETVCINNSRGISNNGVWSLTKCKSLKTLLLPNNPTVSDESLDHISKITGLQTLDLNNINMSDDSMRQLSTLFSLTHLNLGSNSIKDAGAYYLKPLCNLKELHLYSTGVSDEAMEYISSLPCVTKLHIGYTRVTDDGFTHLCKLTKLEELMFNNTCVSDDGVRKLLESNRGMRAIDTRFTMATREVLEGFLQLLHFKGVLKIYGINCY